MFLLKQTTHRMLMQYDQEVGHRFVPNLRARIPNEDGGYYVVTNSLGFRSDWEFPEKKSDKTRILMYGDSYTAGDNVSNCDRYSDLLAEMTGAEVFNFGVSGSGTDQHLLTHRKFGRHIDADLVVICVQVDSFNRIKAESRPSIDRVTGRKVVVPKPYFSLTQSGLELNNVPVPRDRPFASESDEKNGDELLEWAHDLYEKVPGLKEIRNSSMLKDVGSRLITEYKKLRGHHPYPDIVSDDTQGWRLMEAILLQFISEVKPLPVVIFPIPTQDFYVVGMEPIYQPLFEKLEKKVDSLHVGDVSTPLVEMPFATRQKLTYEVGGHFTPLANRLVAETMHKFLEQRNLVPKTPQVSRPVTTSKIRTDAEKHYVLGVSCFYHNSSAALICDGKIVAAADEERFTRVKNDRRFPQQAINYCMEEAGISQHDLAAVAFYDNSGMTFERILQGIMAVDHDSASRMWAKAVPEWIRMKLHFPKIVRKFLNYDGPVVYGNHHRSHAASSFYPSPFESAAILTLDGVGEWATASIGVGRGNRTDLVREMHFPNSLGLLYSAFTHFTGFKVNSGEYKMMGLAPYGRPIYVQQILDHIVDVKEDGSLQLNMEYFSFLHDLSTTSPKFDELFGGPRRDPESRITRREMDLARSIQEVTEIIILRMAKTARELTGEKHLCIAGGVALNCVANGRLLREGIFDDIWIQPAAGDSGCALGVALDVWHTYLGKPRSGPNSSEQGGSYLGPGYSSDEIQAYLDTHGYPYRHMSSVERNKFLSEKLQEGKVVGHFSGRLEYGPRSLGARSIIGDPRNVEMQVNLNLRIKYRESFRPFAPAVLSERVSDYFELDRESPYMLLVAPVSEDRRIPFSLEKLDSDDDMLALVRQMRSDLPAITHVDYSARVQSVKREHHAEFYDLIKQFESDTGCGVVVNTSFNVRGEPIVNEPQDAYRCFMRTEMDVLALGDYVLVKGEQPEWPEGKGEGLENEDITKVAPVEAENELSRILAQSFERSFWPQAEQLKNENALRINLQEPKRSTTWLEVKSLSDADERFVTGTTSDPSSAPTAKQLTASILGTWMSRDVAEKLTPVIEAIIGEGLKQSRLMDVDEPISESVYVMF
ncbi:Decarbamoylnovobiocin carbamoyltransferase [Planctomycetes bacterium CA13]|uniref:Decarbamoylnovobiocin carbamoyltransferase n=1 Tax=Novipirellula herctigrandis TaxID=2527986 RepID=A0A5C5Z1G4_9BACT|nr:Decarbamoylnovobiocin carbamoyltransferase [Planctomycetes bacterium CA13]